MSLTLLRWLLAAPSEPNEAPYICWLAADLVVYSCLAAQPEGSDPTLCSRDISLPAVTAAPYPISILCLWSVRWLLLTHLVTGGPLQMLIY